ncbi:MAG: KilA-N domain-containing protein [Crocinitomicaceae bacterium]
MNKLKVQEQEITIQNNSLGEFISLTDMLKAKDGNFFISDWLRNRNTVEFLGVWESINNPVFNYGEFAIIKSKAGLNNYKLSVKEWITKTSAIGLKASSGRYGGTYAHIDIAFEFGMWISAEFKVYLIKEYKRLKLAEIDALKIEWSFQRNLTKVNYKIHTDAIKENLIPSLIEKNKISMVYAQEADVLNMAVFGKTAKTWTEENQNLKGNIRDNATIQQLVVLSNLESINALFINEGVLQKDRLIRLNRIAITQMKSLLNIKEIDKLQ